MSRDFQGPLGSSSLRHLAVNLSPVEFSGISLTANHSETGRWQFRTGCKRLLQVVAEQVADVVYQFHVNARSRLRSIAFHPERITRPSSQITFCHALFPFEPSDEQVVSSTASALYEGTDDSC